MLSLNDQFPPEPRKVMRSFERQQFGPFNVCWEPKRDIVQEFRTVVADRKAPKTGKDDCASMALARVSLSAREIANIINCMKRGNYGNDELLENLAKRVLESKSMVENFTAIEMSMALHSLAVMYARFHSAFPSFKKLCSALICECVKREHFGYKVFNEQSIANVTRGLGMICDKDDGLLSKAAKTLLDCMLVKITKSGGGEDPRIAKCNYREFSDIVHGLLLLKYRKSCVLDVVRREIGRAKLARSKKRRLFQMLDQITFVEPEESREAAPLPVKQKEQQSRGVAQEPLIWKAAAPHAVLLLLVIVGIVSKLFDFVY